MRVEQHRGRYLLCGGIIPRDKVQPGQTWAGSSGATVTVEKADPEWVTYGWAEGSGGSKSHTKENFAFQCRYCLVLDTPELPAWAA